MFTVLDAVLSGLADMRRSRSSTDEKSATGLEVLGKDFITKKKRVTSNKANNLFNNLFRAVC